jgi:CheY-specific phosphatase CheX
MNYKVSNALTQAAVLTFQKIGLLGLIRDVVPRNTITTLTSGVAVNFHGDRHGTVMLNLSPELLPIITENYMGDHEAPSEELQIDALGEVANTICGNIIPMIYGKSLVIRLDAPEYVAFSSIHKSAGDIRLEFDEGHADVSLYLNEAVAI